MLHPDREKWNQARSRVLWQSFLTEHINIIVYLSSWDSALNIDKVSSSLFKLDFKMGEQKVHSLHVAQWL